jgi:hypothetical protein
MSGKEVWFRSSDGTEKCCNEGSVAFGIMSKDGSFTPISGPGGEELTGRTSLAPDTNAEKKPVDLNELTVKQLQERAALLDVPATPKMKKADLIAAIEAKLAETKDEE